MSDDKAYRDGRLIMDTKQELADEVLRLRSAVEEIKKATIEGRVCDDVAWFDTITTLHDYCDQTLNPGGLSEQLATGGKDGR